MLEHERPNNVLNNQDDVIDAKALRSVVAKLAEENSRRLSNEQILKTTLEPPATEPAATFTPTTHNSEHKSWFFRANNHLSVGLGALAIDGGLVVTTLAFPDEIMLLELPFLETWFPGVVIFFGVIGFLGLASGFISEVRKFFKKS